MARRKKQSISFPSENQDAALDSVFTATAEEVKADAKTKKEVKKAAEEIPVIFTAEQVSFILHLYVFLISFILSFVLKVDFKKVHEELKLEDAEALRVAEPLARVASKHAPATWAGMTAEIELIAWAGIWTVTAFRRVSAIADAEKKKKDAPVVAPPPRSIHDTRPMAATP